MFAHFGRQAFRERFGRHGRPHGHPGEAPADAGLGDPFDPQAQDDAGGPHHHGADHHGRFAGLHAWLAGPRGMFGGGPFGPHGGGPFGGGPFGGHRGGPPHRGGRGGRLFTHGGLRFVILAMIEEKPRHGYEIIKEIEDKVGGGYTPSAGVVYPTLTLLEETGLVEVVASEGNKKLYGLTDAGRQTLAANRAEVDDNLARMNAAHERSAGDRDPRLVRAVENLKLALHLKLSGQRLSDGEVAALASLLDDTAKRIEAL